MQGGPTWTRRYSQAQQGPSGTWEWLVSNGWLRFMGGEVDANATHPVKPGRWCWEHTRGDSAGSSTLATADADSRRRAGEPVDVWGPERAVSKGTNCHIGI